MKLIYALIFLAVASVVLCDKNQDRFKHKSNKKWEEFKKHHQKSFKHDDEEEKRFRNFLKTDEVIEKHNQDFSEGKATFELAHNEFSDMTEEEKKARTGALPPNFAKRDIERREIQYQATNQVAPASVDWSSKWNQPIRNQGSCGSCWAYATCATMEFHYFNQTGKIAQCSPQYLVDCATSQYLSYGCGGGWYWGAVSYIKDTNGAPLDSTYPYINAQGSCKALTAAQRVFKAAEVSRIRRGSEADLLNAVAFKGPVITCINAVGGFFNYKSGIYRDTATIGTSCNHAVVIVGYGADSNGQKYWKIRNSWGAGYGENGHIRLARDGQNYGQLWDYNTFPNPAKMA